ncbi:hypothetical protein ACFQ9H_37720, partial [Streptomyces sp. NPDC056517]|uniref:hypothetical protein n=1 Tax=Streptomyces sp. NPDC056517 TaxID=3345848 RepID=UPI00369CBA92
AAGGLVGGEAEAGHEGPGAGPPPRRAPPPPAGACPPPPAGGPAPPPRPDSEASEPRARTAEPEGAAAPKPATPTAAVPAPAAARRRGGRAPNRRPSGRERHDEKITVYVSAEELMDLEHARLVLRGEHGLAVDRGRIVREAVAVVLADLESRGDASILVRRLRGR